MKKIKKYLIFDDYTLVGLCGGILIGKNFGFVGSIIGGLFGAIILNHIFIKNKNKK